MENLKVGDKRVFTISGVPFEITAIGKNKILASMDGIDDELVFRVDSVLTLSDPCRNQEQKPTRKLEAWEDIGNIGKTKGVIEFCLSDSDNSKENSTLKHSYRKLSDEELKELIRGVIGE